MAPQTAISKATSSSAVPAKNVLPNLSTWRFPTTGCSVPNFTISQSAPQGLSGAPNKSSDNNAMVHRGGHVTSGGTNYYLNPSSRLNIVGGAKPDNVSVAALTTVRGPEDVPAWSISMPRPEPTAFTVVDVGQLLGCSTKDHLHECKLAQYNGDSLQWHEWFGQFGSAIDSASLTDNVKLTYLKSLMTGRVETVIAEFAHCGAT